MDRKKLRELTRKHEELKILLDEIDSVKIYPSTEITGMPRGGGTSDSVVTAACHLLERKDRLKIVLRDIQILRGEIINEISGIDTVTYDILYLRLVSGLCWRQVAVEVGSTEEAVRQVYSRLQK